jgi:uncharacterized membrane protein
MSDSALAAILGMAAVTYATRAGGLWLMRRRQPPAVVERALKQVPGAVLVALVAPGVVVAGWPGVAGAGIAAATARRTGNVLLAVVVGVAIVWLLRQIS